MVSHEVDLGINVFLMIVCILQILANFVVLYVWWTSKRLYKNDNLILLVSLAFIDFLYAVLQFPLLVHILRKWVPNDEPYHYDGTFIYWMGGPSAALMKAGCSVTTFIALDRCLALHCPVMYYKQTKRMWCVLGFLISMLLAAIDWAIQLTTVDIVPEDPACSTFGCFMPETFKMYWGLSNCFVNLLSCLLTLFFLYHLYERSKLRDLLAQQIEKENRTKIDRNANRVSMYILIVSAVIGVVPGCLNGTTMFFHQFKILNEVSAFVGTCATLSGLSHAFIFAMAHREIRNEIMTRIFKVSDVSQDGNSRLGDIKSIVPIRPMTIQVT